MQVHGDTSATPTVVNGTVYIVDWGFPDYSDIRQVGPRFVGDGHLTAVTASTGKPNHDADFPLSSSNTGAKHSACNTAELGRNERRSLIV